MADQIKKKLRLRIVTPETVKDELDADMVIMRCNTGDLGVLPDHDTLSAVLDYGVLRIFDEGTEKRMAVFGGLAQIKQNVVTLLVNSAQWPGEINRVQVENEIHDAQRRLQEETDDVNLQKDSVNLRRSLVQLEVSSYPLINKPE